MPLAQPTVPRPSFAASPTRSGWTSWPTTTRPAFEIVLERHADAAFSLAYRMVGRRSLAEDVVQEAFLSAWRSGTRYDRTRGGVRAWILGIVHNRAVDTLRRDGARERRNVTDEGLEERLEAPELTEVEAARREDASPRSARRSGSCPTTRRG